MRAQLRASVIKSLADQLPSEFPSGNLSFDRLRRLSQIEVVVDEKSGKSETVQSIIDRFFTASEYDLVLGQGNGVLGFVSAYKDIVDDVESDLLSVGELIRVVTTFKENFAEKYQAAFVSMSLPDLLEPLVLLDITPTSLNIFSYQQNEIKKKKQEGKRQMEISEDPHFEGLGLGFGLGLGYHAQREKGTAEAKEEEEVDRGESLKPFDSEFVSIADRDWQGPLGAFSQAAEELAGDAEADPDALLLPKVSILEYDH